MGNEGDFLQVKRQAKRLNKTCKGKAKVAVLRIKLKSLIKKSRYEYYNVKMTNFLVNDPVKFWRHLQGTRQHVTKIEERGREVGDKSAIAKTFNNYFSSVFTINDGESPEYRERAIGVPDVQVTQEGIFEALLNLNTKKSSGPDNVPNAFLKRYAEWCSKFLFVIFNNVLEQAIVPDQWKTAKVIPIHEAVTGFKCVTIDQFLCFVLAARFSNIFYSNISTLRQITSYRINSMVLGAASRRLRSFFIL